jgi:hypothetical protein
VSKTRPEAVGGAAEDKHEEGAEHDGTEYAESDYPAKILLDVADYGDGDAHTDGYGEVPPVE